MNTHDKYELPPLPETDWYAVWHGQTLYGIYATLTEATDAAAKLNCKGSVSALFTEQHLQEAQRAAIEADRQARGEPVAQARNAALEEAGQVLDRLHDENRQYHTEFRRAAIAVRTLKSAPDTPQPQQQASGWPKVNGVGRVLGSEQSLEVYFDSEPSDDQLRAVHNFLTSPQPQQIPEGYKKTLREFLAALDKAHSLEKSTSAWVYRTQGSFIERQKAWAEVNRLRAMLEAAPESKGQP